MYEQSQEHKTKYRQLPQMNSRGESAAKRPRGGNPYEGTPLSVSGRLAGRIRDSFGIDAGELELRESPEVAGMGARAIAQGNAIRFAPGEFRPDTDEGLRVLGHELSHVREQAVGDVHANVPGSNIHYDSGHEAAGDRAGESFAAGETSGASEVSVGGSNASAAPMQGLWLFDKLKRAFSSRRRRRGKKFKVSPIDELRDIDTSLTPKRVKNEIRIPQNVFDGGFDDDLNSAHEAGWSPWNDNDEDSELDMAQQRQQAMAQQAMEQQSMMQPNISQLMQMQLMQQYRKHWQGLETFGNNG